jgi:hypothetical protein
MKSFVLLLVLFTCAVTLLSTRTRDNVFESYDQTLPVVQTIVPSRVTIDPQTKLSVRSYGPKTPLMKHDKYHARLVVHTSDHLPETLTVEGTYDPTVLRLTSLSFNRSVTVNENTSGNGLLSFVAAFNDVAPGVIDIGHMSFDVIHDEDADEDFDNVYDLGKVKITSDKSPYSSIIVKKVEYIDHKGGASTHGRLSFIRGKAKSYPDPVGNTFRVVAPFSHVTVGDKFVCRLQVHAYDDFKDFTGRGFYDNTKIRLEEVRSPDYVDIVNIVHTSDGSLALSTSFKRDAMTKALGFMGGPAIDICEFVFVVVYDGKEDAVLTKVFEFGQNALTSAKSKTIVVDATEHADHRDTFNTNAELLFKAYKQHGTYPPQSLNTVRSYGPTVPLTEGDKYTVELVLNAGIDIATRFEVTAAYDPKSIDLSTITVPSYIGITDKTNDAANGLFRISGNIYDRKTSGNNIPLGTATFNVVYSGRDGDRLANVLQFKEVKVYSTISTSDNIISKNIEHMDDRATANKSHSLMFTTKGRTATARLNAPADAPFSDAPADAPSDAPADAPFSDAPADAPFSEAPADAPFSEAPADAPADAPEDTPLADARLTEHDVNPSPVDGRSGPGGSAAVEGYSLHNLVDKYPAKTGNPLTTILIVLALLTAIPGLYYCMHYLPQNTPADGIRKICGVALCVTLIVWAFSVLITVAGLVQYARMEDESL